MHIKRMTPMLNVSDVHRSLRFYQEVAGFELRSPRQAVDEWRWATIQSGDCTLMLAESGGPAPHPSQISAQGEEGWPVIYYFYPDDVVSLRGALRQKGFPVSKLRVTFYGMKEFELHDPDGHLLWFGQEAGEPPSEKTPSQEP